MFFIEQTNNFLIKKQKILMVVNLKTIPNLKNLPLVLRNVNIVLLKLWVPYKIVQLIASVVLYLFGIISN